MLKALALAAALAAAAAAYIGPCTPYIITELRVEDIPRARPDGSDWNGTGGPPEIFVAIHYESDVGEPATSRSSVREAAGNSAVWTPDYLLVQLGDPGYSGPEAPPPEVLDEWDPHVEFEVMYEGPRGPETMDRGEMPVSEISFDEENVLRCSRGSVITFSLRSYH